MSPALTNILDAHNSGVTIGHITLTVAGTPTIFHCREHRVVDLNTPTVILLTEDSTPQSRTPRDEAETDLERAFTTLMEDGKPFYTMLRGNWNLPTIQWSVRK
jgi:hypothetical protein